jgi:hypothetical protein
MKLQIPLMNPWKDVLVHLALWAVLLSIPSFIYSFFPKPDFDAVLRSQYPNQIALVIGGKDSFSGDTAYARRSYLLVSFALQVTKIVRVTQINSEPPKAVEQKGLFLVTLAIFIGFISYYFWKRWRAQSDDT